MVLPILGLAAVSFFISFLLTFVMIRVAPRIGFVDRPGHRKIHSNPKPLGGGVAIFLGIAVPMLVGLAVIDFCGEKIVLRYRDWVDIQALVTGGQHQTPLSLGFLGGMLALHALG